VLPPFVAVIVNTYVVPSVKRWPVEEPTIDGQFGISEWARKAPVLDVATYETVPESERASVKQ
jgi:hypothetical protein